MADTEVNLPDVYARRGDEHLYAEAKGRTTDAGLDVDTLYGQLLRRMTDPDAAIRYAVVVPTAAVRFMRLTTRGQCTHRHDRARAADRRAPQRRAESVRGRS
jgi:hypothetical protein